MKSHALLFLACSLSLACAQSPSPTPTPAPAVVPEGVTRLFLSNGQPWSAESGETESDPAVPSIDLYPVKSDKPVTAVVILPGGGYRNLSMAREGRETAEFLNKCGVAAFVVRYRHSPRFSYPTPLEDALRAVRFVRSRAAEYNVAPDRIGVMGYSAGGHLASMVVTRFEEGKAGATDPLEQLSSRPDFALLVYPVITFTADPYVHAGSRTHLTRDDQALYRELSSELQVRLNSPPVFLVSGGADKGVPPENSLLFYQACREAKVPAELHIYQDGGHGLKEKNHQSWREWAADWMFRNGWISRPSFEQ